MLTLKEVAQETPESLDAKRVNCGQCPVSLYCVAGDKEIATGFIFSCCNVTTLQLGGYQEILVVDCGRHNFYARASSMPLAVCPLCEGKALAADRVNGYAVQYLPTVHARVDSQRRIDMLREELAREETKT